MILPFRAKGRDVALGFLGPRRGPGWAAGSGQAEEVAQVPESYTGQYLKQLLDKRGGASPRGKRPAQTEAAE